MASAFLVNLPPSYSVMRDIDLPSNIDLPGASLAKEKRKCRLATCQEMTDHNGGYCSSAHCKQDRSNRYK
jgi:hypothetical protein